jgi:hypothetical protein
MRVLLILAVILALASKVSLADGSLPHSFRFITVDAPGAISTRLHGINNHGHIVGRYLDATGRHAFVYDGTQFKRIDFPGWNVTEPYDINDHGHVVGIYGSELYWGAQGFFYDGVSHRRFDVPNAGQTIPRGINNHGHIVGAYRFGGHQLHTEGFIFDGQAFETINFPDSLTSSLDDITDSGLAVGSTTVGLRRPSFFYSDGRFSTFHNGNAIGEGINNHGFAVGSFESLAAVSGFVDDGELSASIDVPRVYVPLEGGIRTFVTGINDSGVIVGYYEVENGAMRGFIGVPVPEPSAIALATCAMLLVGIKLAQRRTAGPWRIG